MKTKNFIQYFLIVLVMALLSGCGNQSDETAAKDIVVETKEEQVDSTNPDVYWDNVNTHFTNVEDAIISYSNTNSDIKSLHSATEKLVDSLNDAQDRLVNLNVPDYPGYQEYHQQLVDTLPRLVNSFEVLLTYFPESTEDYANNPQFFDVSIRNVDLESNIYETTIQRLKEKRTALQAELQ